ncbi:unnamed protein product, partial [Mesorhabditis belari]|uniref:Peptidase C1A papain C-terminal domain-containing protein n=1 Tax=Mesorhabditis belari TaxID=2138241 RepID=A0AAF3FB83_9BILA
MRFYLIFFFFFVATNGLSAASLKEKFERFLEKNNVTLTDAADFLKKLKNYVNRSGQLDKLREKLKARGAKYTLDETRFMDWSDEDLRKIVINEVFVFDVPPTTEEPSVIPKLRWFPSGRRKRSSSGSFDWRTSGLVGPVKDQGACGSCWAFGAIGAIEVQWKKHYNTGTFSEQQIVDCDKSNNACNGGSFVTAFDYIIKNGLAVSADYPYVSGQTKSGGGCQVPPKSTTVTIDRYKWLQSIDQMEYYLETVGPFVIKIYVPMDLFYYSSGIFVPDNSTCSPSNNQGGHILTVVGYGSENGQAFWIVRNSWGDRWGEGGYIRFAKGENHCVIEAYPYIPAIKGVLMPTDWNS